MTILDLKVWEAIIIVATAWPAIKFSFPLFERYYINPTSTFIDRLSDPWAGLASILFFVGCFVYLILAFLPAAFLIALLG